MRPVGDDALDDQVSEEHRRNAAEETQRFQAGQAGSSWIGNVLSRTFNYDSKSDIDFGLIEVRNFIEERIDSQSRQDLKFLEAFRYSYTATQ